MDQSEGALVLNPVITQYKKRYIFGVDGNAAAIFMELCTRHIYIDGFVDDANAGIHFFHKPVCGMPELMANQEAAVLLSYDSLEETEGCHTCSDIFVLNPKLQGRTIIMSGTVREYKAMYSILLEKGAEAAGYISWEEDSGIHETICGKIWHKDQLHLLPEDAAVILVGNSSPKLALAALSCRHDLLVFCEPDIPFQSDAIWINRERGLRLPPGAVAQLGEYYEQEKIKEIILYGNNCQLARQYAGVYECLDFGPVSFMSDIGSDDGQEIPLIEEILYKENYLLLLYDEEKKYSTEKLLDLGVEKRYYGKPCPWNAPNLNARTPLLDVNMGHTFQTNYTYPGIYIHGKNRATDYKIAVLGGSTTDAAVDDRIRPWTEILHDTYCPDGVTIFNGGISGYYSGQELIKLTRDMTKLHPDMVLVFDGYNDLIQNIRDTKFRYLGELVHFAGRHIPSYGGGHLEEEQVWKGIPVQGDPIDDWLENIEYMHAIAKSKNMAFFAFMQPTLFTKKNLDSHSKTLLQTQLFHEGNQECIDIAQRFRERAPEIIDTHDYIYDLSDIFDDADVYMDVVHVYEKGNEIIAKEIWNRIKDSFHE